MSSQEKPALIGPGPLAGLGAFIFWGFFGLYFKQVAFATPFEILSHRIVWSAALTLLLVFVLGRRKKLWELISSARTLGLLFLSSLLVAGNWLLYIWAVTSAHALEASLGYYIMPLIMLILGRIFFAEKLNRIQILSVAICAAGVLNLLVFYGDMPWVALGLSTLFGFYGVIRKFVPADPIAGLFVECILITPIALGYLFWIAHTGDMTFGQIGWVEDALLIGLGICTTGPLVMFAYAARNMKFSALGLMQYLNPTIQFFVAVLIFGEAFTEAHMITYGLVWVGLAIFTWDNLRTARQNRAKS
ncbi:permease [Thalassospira sp. HJ]|uniref:EamA family transporter RarD n=1 Tax=unclassified Thalassospira TaxID=2648997 RepID=UPI0005CE4CE3|nr:MULTISPECIES: EamA family transporter RarD [unclassified Thalassospira]KJE36271.1 permease [Thalassospira sp. HJ]MBC06761.1 EamA family transporter [Thalassospira sp.]|tara:strand:- start:5630 stop:6538 length:909 start_codon:yes stop_codon:yes gene_type:complete